MSTMPKGSSADFLSAATRYLPSGDQSRWRPTASIRVGNRDVITPWTPPPAGETRISVSFWCNAKERDSFAVGRPYGTQVLGSVRRNPEHRAVVHIADVDIRVVVVLTCPNERDLLAVRRERGLSLIAGKARKRNRIYGAELTSRAEA